MAELVKVKVRNIGSSAGIIIPQNKLLEAGVEVGDEIEVAILPAKKDFSGFGVAKHFKGFERDKKVRKF